MTKRRPAPKAFDLAAARARLAAYRSILADLDAESRRAVLADQGPEAAGRPGAHDEGTPNQYRK